MIGNLIKFTVGAALLGAAGYLGYQRFWGSTGTMECAVDTPWYLPAPKYSCGESRGVGEIAGLQYQRGEWIYAIKVRSSGGGGGGEIEGDNVIYVKERDLVAAANVQAVQASKAMAGAGGASGIIYLVKH